MKHSKNSHLLKTFLLEPFDGYLLSSLWRSDDRSYDGSFLVQYPIILYVERSSQIKLILHHRMLWDNKRMCTGWSVSLMAVSNYMGAV